MEMIMTIIASRTLIDLYEKNPAVCPSRSHVCTTCPNAIWHGTNNNLKAYCRIFFREEWNSADNKFKAYCDGNPTPPDVLLTDNNNVSDGESHINSAEIENVGNEE